MLQLKGEKIYLTVLERNDCVVLYDEFEYDFNSKTEPLHIGHSTDKSYEWFDDIQKKQGYENVRLGIFLPSGKVIGDVALQGIDWKNRVCSIGIGIARIENRCKGYGKEAVQLMLDYGFNNLGLERITATTLEQNIPMQKALESLSFVLEGKERKAVYFAGKRYDKFYYGLLAEEYSGKSLF